jgi:hypothetical protein
VWRFLALATAIVFGAMAVILALPKQPSPSLPAPRYTSGDGTPGPSAHDDGRRQPPPVTGNAPWALSALPECFHQRAGAHGPPAFARARIPRGARPVAAPATLQAGDCTLVVAADSATVTRGENRLLIPAVARFYVAGDRLILERSEGARDDVRVYVLTSGARPAFRPPKT